MRHYRSSLCALLLLPVGLAALAAAARAAEMSLQRAPLQRDSSQVDLFVHGAPAGAPLVLFVYPGLPGAAGGEPVHTFTGRADALGRAHFAVAGIPLSDDLWTVRAVARPEGGGQVWSNVEILKEVSSVYLLVESPRGGSVPTRLVRFDPFRQEVQVLAEGVSRHTLTGDLEEARRFEVAGPIQQSFFEESGDPVAIRVVGAGDPAGAPPVPLGEERVVDMVSTADQSAILVLTEETTAEGRTVLRLRLLDAAEARWNGAALRILQSERTGFPAVLRPGSDSRQVFVGEWSDGSGKILECAVNGALSEVTWIAPTPDPASETLFQFESVGDLLVAVSRRREGTGRLTVFDLRRETLTFESPIAGTPLDLKTVQDRGSRQALVLTDARENNLVVFTFAGAEAPEVSLQTVPGARRIAASPGMAHCFVLAQDEARTRIVAVDRRDLTVGAGSVEVLHGSRGLGVLDGSAGSWLFFFEPDGTGTGDRMVCVPVDGVTGAVDADTGSWIRRDLGGSVTRVRVREWHSPF